MLRLLLIICSMLFVQFTEAQWSTDIPLLKIETNGVEISIDSAITAHMEIMENPGNRNYLTDSANIYHGFISIKHRGSSSLTFPKKQYRIETQTATGENRNEEILGMPEENDWILSAPYSDKTLIRNQLIYETYRKMGHYSPRSRACELFLNGGYQGVYVITEKIKKDDGRVDLADLNPDDLNGDELTGGYLLKIDRLDQGATCSGWTSAEGGVHIQFEYPKCEDVQPEQREYIKELISHFEAALFNSDSEAFWSLVDVESLVDYFLVNEISKNVDAYRLSTYLTKDKDSRGGQLSFGPPWDYNISLGNVDYLGGYLTQGYVADSQVWWSHIRRDSIFRSALKSRWHELRSEGGLLSNNQVLTTIDSLSAELLEARHRNFNRWGVLGEEIWPNYFVGQNYEQEIAYLNSWIVNRLNWMDQDILRSNNGGSESLLIYPNPFFYFITIELDCQETGDLEISLVNELGQEVIRKKYGYQGIGKKRFLLNTDQGEELMNNGVYVLNVWMGKRLVHSESVFKSF